MEAADRVLRKANEAVDREERNEALLDLCGRVDDWKNHRVDQFGELLLHGHFPVVTGKSDVQKEVRSPSVTDSSASAFSTSGVAMGFCDPFGGVLLTSRDTIVTTTGGKSRTASTTSITSSATSRKSGASTCSKWDAPKADLTIVTKEDESLGEQVSIEQQSLRSSVPSSEPPLLFSSKQLSSRQLDNFMNGLRFYQAGGIDRKTGERDIKLAVNYANEEGISCPQFEQYTIYLFERILLCCKEINPNKSKDKIMGTQKDKKDKNKKRGQDKNAKLQLKGRIFMTNVTEVVSFAKLGKLFEPFGLGRANSYIGSYTVQIFWKGDPGVENFIIRFSNEETMNKWYQGVDNQRKQHASSIIGNSPDAPPAEFAWTRDQTAMMPNPYAQADEDDDEDEYPGQQTSPYIGQSGMTRNASNTSLRSRSTTGESQQSLAGIARAPPPRFPMGLTNPPLSLQTTMSSAMPSPGQRVGDSYFSPVAESPASSRTSMASSMFPFPRQGTPQSVWDDPSNRYTAPALARAPSRDSSTPVNNAYQMNGRTPQRPSLPVMASGSQASIAQQRSRSYSTPDIDGQNGYRPRNGPPSGPVPAVPGIPPHLQHPAYDAGIPRSANNSPNGIPVRSSTQSPGAQRERQAAQYSNGSQYTRPPPVTSDSRTMSPPLNSAVSNLSTDSDIGLPTQLKVKVNCDGNYVTLVVAFNIAYQSLIDRIDAKVGRFSNNAIAAGTMRLRYRDEDGDFVTIESDDDIQIAFQEWREAQKLHYHTGQLGEIELFCLSVENNNSQ
jgi:cell division control protein 24